MLATEGVTRYDPLNDAFDPNLHNALFEVPDATKEPGTVAVVVKVRSTSSACREGLRRPPGGAWLTPCGLRGVRGAG